MVRSRMTEALVEKGESFPVRELPLPVAWPAIPKVIRRRLRSAGSDSVHVTVKKKSPELAVAGFGCRSRVSASFSRNNSFKSEYCVEKRGRLTISALFHATNC